METPQPGRRRFSTAPQAPASKPASEATTLRTIYAPVLAYVVLFQRTADKGGVTADKLRAPAANRENRGTHPATFN